MRRLRLALLAAVALAATALLGSPSSAQSGEGKGQETATLEIVKVVEGDGPTGGYVIEYSCVEDDISDLSAEGAGGFGGALAFDAAGPGNPETQTVVITEPSTCTVTETDSNGAATVTYQCTFVPSQQQVPSAGPFAEGLPAGGCVSDQAVSFGRPGEVGTITVTNTFDADVIDDVVDPPPDVGDDVVTATPTFTG